MINVIFLPAVNVTPAGVCSLTFYTLSEMRLGKDKLVGEGYNLLETLKKPKRLCKIFGLIDLHENSSGGVDDEDIIRVCLF